MTNKNKARKQQLWVLLTALVIIGLSVSSTLYLTGALQFASGDDGGGSGYRNVSFTDAYLECDSYTRERYESRLRRLSLDDHSSRYDNSGNVFKIFMQLDMHKPPNSPEPEPYWVNCFVSADNGKITHYQVGEDKNIPVAPVRKDGNGRSPWF